MNIFLWLLITAIVLCATAGQILFKVVAVYWVEAGNIFSSKILITFMMAILLYGFTTLAWILVLRKVNLGYIYPFMSLLFITVPLASYFIFHEKFSLQYFGGVALIMIGIVIALKS